MREKKSHLGKDIGIEEKRSILGLVIMEFKLGAKERKRKKEKKKKKRLPCCKHYENHFSSIFFENRII